MSAVKDQLIGHVLDDRYMVIEQIARGGMAVVYRGVDMRLDRDVAIKVMHPHLTPDDGFVTRFRNEALHAARLSHSNLVAVHDQGREDDTVYLVMEYLPSETLRDRLKREGRLTPREAIIVIDAILAALQVVHESGIIHRDLKPDNILLGSGGQIKLADFGLARAVSSSTTTKTLIGTVGYVAPELVTRSETDARTDLYTVGIVLYEMLTGHPPYTDDMPIQVAYRHVHDSVPPPSEEFPELPGGLDDLVVWATQRKREDRPADAAEMRLRLHRVRSELTDAELDMTPLDRDDLRGLGPAHETAEPDADEAAAPAPAEPITAPSRRRGFFRRSAARIASTTRILSHQEEQAAAVAAGAGAATAGTNASGAADRGDETAVELDGARPGDSSGAEQPEPRDELSGFLTTEPTDESGAAEPQTAEGLSEFDPAAGALGHDDSSTAAASSEARSAASTLADEKDKEHEEAGSPTVGGEGLPTGSGAAPAAEHGRTGAGAATRRPSRRRVTGIAVLALVLAAVITAVWAFAAGPLSARTVPADLSGIEAQEAVSQLEGLGFEVTVTQEYDEEIPEGRVLGTEPAGGTELRRGDAVTLITSQGPQLFTVPDLAGLRLEEAQSRLEEAGLTLGEVTEEYSDSVSEGDLISQAEEAGAELRAGSAVDVVVSQGVEPIEVPNVRGLTYESAAATLSRLGFLVAREDVFDQDVPSGRVISQSPGEGADRHAGDLIMLKVSKGAMAEDEPADDEDDGADDED